MGKGMGAVDKNMRKELSLEIDGHACPDQYVNVGIGVEIKCRTPHAIDAMSTQLTGRLPHRTSRRSSSKKLLGALRDAADAPRGAVKVRF